MSVGEGEDEGETGVGGGFGNWEIMGLGAAGGRVRGGKGRYSKRGRRGSWVEGVLAASLFLS